MILSRVAESVYWAGRYLERAEATARLVKVHTELFLDLPRAAGVGWSPLLAVTGSGEEFLDRHPEPSEENVVDFLTVDTAHAGSVRSSVRMARENLRVTQALLPRTAWEALNELHHWLDAHEDNAVDRRTRLSWTDEVIRRTQLLQGIVVSTMSQDETYSFLEIGRFLERADMTTRVLDVQAGILLGGPSLGAYADVTWMSILKSLAARQMFRRSMPAGVSGPEALRFLLKDAQFPRSVEHCMTQTSRALLELPSYDAPMAGCAEVQALLEEVDVEHLEPLEIHEFVDELQLGIAALHGLLNDSYFSIATEAPPESLVVPA